MPHKQNEPYQYDPSDITVFAQTNFRQENRRFGIRTEDRRRHMYIIGKTGMGKSTLLENMIIQDIQTGKGVAVVDPHGDLVEKVLKFIPPHRINDIVYFNPSDTDYPISFNILENVDPELKNLVSNGLVGVFKKIWADSWGPRLEYILINAILALLEYPGSTLLGVTRMLVDAKYRKKVVQNITDPVVKSFWVEEFNNYSEKFRNEAIAPIQNKVGQFLSSALIRNIVGQTKSTIDMREIMDSGKILLMNLSKGRIGEENAALLGAMMITKIQLAAMSRVDTPENERRDFYLYVDEFQNFSTDSFANILSEARKYRLNLIMAHQYIEQLSDSVKAAVFGNIGTLVTFRVGAIDAEELEKEYTPTFTQEDIVQLPAYHIYLRLMINGVASDPFSAATLPPISGETENREKVIQESRQRYSTNRKEVEESISTWAGFMSGQQNEDGEEQKEKKPQPKSATYRPKREPTVSAASVPSATPAAAPATAPAAPPSKSTLPASPAPQIVQPAPTQEDDLTELKEKKLSFVSKGVAQSFTPPPPPSIPSTPPPTPSVAPAPVAPVAPTSTSAPARPPQIRQPQPSITSAPGQVSQQNAPGTDQKRKRRRRRRKPGDQPMQGGQSQPSQPRPSQGSRPQTQSDRPQPSPASSSPSSSSTHPVAPGQRVTLPSQPTQE